MSRRCELTGRGVQTGNNVSHSNVKTRRRFLPNLQQVSLYSDKLAKRFCFRASTRALRIVDHRGGLDAHLLKTDDRFLSARARNVKAKILGAE